MADFLDSLHQNPYVSTVALVSVPNEIPGSRLGVYTLWEHPVDLLHGTDAEDMERVGRLHDRFAESLDVAMGNDRGYYCTSIHTVAPQRYPSAELLRDDLVRQYGVGS